MGNILQLRDLGWLLLRLGWGGLFLQIGRASCRERV